MMLQFFVLSTLLATATNARQPNDTVDRRTTWNVSQLSERFLLDVTYEKRPHDGSVIVNLRTIGASHVGDARMTFPRNDMQIVIQGSKGAVVFSSSIPWQKTDEVTVEGEPTYKARIMIHPELKHELILSESLDGFDDKPTVGIVTFASLFE